jgi:hypothetical protein
VTLSASGHRKNEPIDIARERPTLVRRAIQRRLNAGESLATIAEDMFISVDELEAQYLEVK